MSIHWMSEAWKLDLEPMETTILVAYADHADEHGRNVRPSLGYMGWKTGFDPDHIGKITKTLRQKGLMIFDGVHEVGSGEFVNKWRLSFDGFPRKEPYTGRDQLKKRRKNKKVIHISTPLRASDGGGYVRGTEGDTCVERTPYVRGTDTLRAWNVPPTCVALIPYVPRTYKSSVEPSVEPSEKTPEKSSDANLSIDFLKTLKEVAMTEDDNQIRRTYYQSLSDVSSREGVLIISTTNQFAPHHLMTNLNFRGIVKRLGYQEFIVEYVNQ